MFDLIAEYSVFHEDYNLIYKKVNNFICFIVIYTYWSKGGCWESFMLWPEHKMSEKYKKMCHFIIV